jgi:hypothetical protein
MVTGLVALVVCLAVAVGVALALMAARDKHEPTWEYRGVTRGCDEITNVEFATRTAFEAWDSQCGSAG